MKKAATTFLLLAISGLAAQKKEDPSPEPPPHQLIELTLVGKREVKVDLGGKTWAEFKKSAEAGNPCPPVPCDLSLQIRNNTKEKIKVRMTGAGPELTVEVTGKPGTRSFSQAGGGAKGGVTYLEVLPGKSATVPLEHLAGRSRGMKSHQVPLGEGEYTVTVSLRTYIYTGEGKAKGKGSALGQPFQGKNPHTLTTPPIKVQVTGK